MHPGTGPIVLPTRPIWSEVDDTLLDASDDEVNSFDDGKRTFRVRMLELYKSWISQMTCERARMLTVM
jgi:hypothetical protein